MGLKHDKNRARAIQQREVVHAMAKAGNIAAVAEYRELTAKAMYEFQLDSRKVGVSIKVIRNRLAKRAIEGTDFACLEPALKGPNILVFSDRGPKVVATLLRDFAKRHDKLVIKNFAFEGELLPASDLDSMANLPTKEEALSILVSVLQLPIHQLLSVLSEPQMRLMRTLMAVKK